MSASQASFGLRPAFHPSGLIRGTDYVFPGNNSAPFASANVYKNSPVGLNSSGKVVVAADTANNSTAATLLTSSFLGSFQGVEYTDGTNGQGRRVVSNQGASSLTYADAVVWIVKDPETIFEIQANGSVAVAAVEDQFNFVAAGTANTGVDQGNQTSGLSVAAMSTTAVASGQVGQVRVVGFGKQVDNAAGDAFTIVRVQVSNHTDRATRGTF